MSTTANITKRQAEGVLAAVKRQCAAWLDDNGNGPALMRDWDWTGYGGARWSVVWEEGPYDWAYLFPFGGIEEEFGFRVKDVSSAIPVGFYAEAITSWAIGIYPS